MSRSETALLVGCIVAMWIGGCVHEGRSQSLPTLRRSAPSQVKIAWDNATNFTGPGARAITSNDWPMLTTRLYRLAPGVSNWVLSSTVPFTVQTSAVTVTTGVWSFAVSHTYVTNDIPPWPALTNDGPWSEILTWTNEPLIPGAAIIR